MKTQPTDNVPVAGPHVWTGADFAGRDHWIIRLGSEEISELEYAVASVRARNLLLEEAGADDFHLPRMSSVLADARDELAQGRGFVLLRGLPLTEFSKEEMGVLFWGLGTHLGIGVSQSRAGDRLGHVIDTGVRDQRYYTRGGEIEFHMDPVDVVGLMCLQSAKSGGASRIISAMQVHNQILKERPDLLPVLQRGFYYSRRAQDPQATAKKLYTPERVAVFKEGAAGMECYFLPVSIFKAAEDGAPFSERDAEAMTYMAQVCARPDHFLDMSFQEGDIQFLNNRTILHARTDYVEHDDPALKRHLLRLWLMIPQWPPRPMSMRPHDEGDRAGGGIAEETAA